MRSRRFAALFAGTALLLVAALIFAYQQRQATKVEAPAGVTRATEGQVHRLQYQTGDRYLVIEVLDDDLLHFELAAGTAPGADQRLFTTPMVARRDYPGPSTFKEDGHTFETAGLRVTVDPERLCVTAFDKARNDTLTTTCPHNLEEKPWKGLTITPESMEHAYGLGEQFITPGQADGDWTGQKRTTPSPYGNIMAGFNGGSVSNAQFPILYAVGPNAANYALFLDDIYLQRWDFKESPWKVETQAEVLRWYLLSGPNLPDLRQDYMELTGRPPVPPKQMFGLWVSEYGYDNWAELDGKLATLKQNSFPVDGFVLDLQWFGGIQNGSDNSSMGRVAWDTTKFPDPAARLAAYKQNEGLSFMPIEESYISKGLPEHADLEQKGYLVRQGCATCPPVYLTRNPWWGKGSMLDWTSKAAGDYWHDLKRQPLIKDGMAGHWIDLGEPEMYEAKDWVTGLVPGKNSHADYHNLYNFAWAESIFRGYQRNGVERRPFILSRSGAPGIQRFGVAMWSGDIGANLSSLATHYNAQMHMSFSGVDYFGSDIGGFHRGGLSGDLLTETYTQWFAAGMLFDIPGRPHTENLCNCKETAPDRIGHLLSNLANVRQRYELIPYTYSLAHRAYRYGEPVMPPAVYYYQNDSKVRELGSLKMLGRDLLAGAIASPGAKSMQVYLPEGTWINYHTNKWYQGAQTVEVPLDQDGIFRLPLFARAGAIIPLMHVDAQTRNALGKRADGTTRDELIARVYAGAPSSSFTLYEDDGESIAYQKGAVRTTEIGQQHEGSQLTVTIKAAEGTYAGAPASRANVVELVTDGGSARAVSLGGQLLPMHTTEAAFDAAASGWYNAGDGVVLAKSGALPVAEAKAFVFTLGQR